MQRLRRLLRYVFFTHLAVGPILILVLAFASPIIIGEGHFDRLISFVETFNFKWWLVGILALAWVVPAILGMIYSRVHGNRLEVTRLNDMLSRMLDHSIPIEVDINDRIPVAFDQKLTVPIELDAKLDIDDTVTIEAEIPIKAEIPLDTIIETSVLGIGKIKIPINARVPIDLLLPLKTSIKLHAHGIPICLREEAIVSLPPVELPLACRLETKIELLANFRHAEELLKHSLDSVDKK